jgi:TRAP-type C4-dicarboxylate transport system substrate-binding protein
MRRITTILFALLLALPSLARAQTVVVKLGTLAPDGSGWHKLLKEMGEKWSEASGGKVKLKVFPGGVAGNESDMVRKLLVGGMDAASLTVVGLHDIDTSPQAIASPGLIGDDAEWSYVFDKMAPIWEQRLADKGFIALHWADTGWVHMFFKKKVKSPAEMKGLKVFAWAGDPSSVKAWELAGFQPVVISSTDILTSLSTGMIDGLGMVPVMVFTARFFEQAKYMTEGAWGHLPGGTIVTKKTWEKIPAEMRPKLLEIAREYGKRVNSEVVKMQTDALAQMKKAGLQVIPFSDADKKAWTEMAERTWPVLRGGMTTPEAFDEVKKLRDEYRASKGKK